MKKLYVYLILSQKRLIITENEILDDDHHLLLRSTGPNIEHTRALCKTYCIGYIIGNKTSGKVINDPQEFK